MTNKDIFKDAFPQGRQVGGKHYKDFHIQPYVFISKIIYRFFKATL